MTVIHRIAPRAEPEVGRAPGWSDAPRPAGPALPTAVRKLRRDGRGALRSVLSASPGCAATAVAYAVPPWSADGDVSGGPCRVGPVRPRRPQGPRAHRSHPCPRRGIGARRVGAHDRAGHPDPDPFVVSRDSRSRLRPRGATGPCHGLGAPARQQGRTPAYPRPSYGRPGRAGSGGEGSEHRRGLRRDDGMGGLVVAARSRRRPDDHRLDVGGGDPGVGGGWFGPVRCCGSGQSTQTLPVDERGGIAWRPGRPSGSVVAPIRKEGKPMPAAGKTAHVRRLFVVRSWCGLGVSPAPPVVPMTTVTGEGQ